MNPVPVNDIKAAGNRGAGASAGVQEAFLGRLDQGGARGEDSLGGRCLLVWPDNCVTVRMPYRTRPQLGLLRAGWGRAPRVAVDVRP